MAVGGEDTGVVASDAGTGFTPKGLRDPWGPVVKSRVRSRTVALRPPKGHNEGDKFRSFTTWTKRLSAEAGMSAPEAPFEPQ